jgi:VCBS repeat-containing protein
MAGVINAAEDGPAISLDLASLADDIDSDDDASTLIYAITSAPAQGSATLIGSDLRFSAGSDFQSLALGETAQTQIEVTATDRHGASTAQTITVTITGTNDAPVITGGLDATPSIETNDANERVLTGTLSYSDIDLSDSHSFSGFSASGSQVVITPLAAATGGGTGLISWAYIANQNAQQNQQDTITSVISDTRLGGTISASINVDLETGNSAPDVSTPLEITTLSGTGVQFVDINDVFIDDDFDILTASADPSQAYAGISFDGTGLIEFDADNAAYQFLGQGETFTVSANFLLSDGTVTQTATVQWTIEGFRTKSEGSDGADELFGDLFSPALIVGGAGVDTLTGGFVENIFAYFSAADGFDLITNFTQGQDKIGISAAGFGGSLLAGGLASVVIDSDFTQVMSAADQGVFILQTDGVNGTLYWDADGGSGDNATAIAQLDNISDLSSDDFFIFV